MCDLFPLLIQSLLLFLLFLLAVGIVTEITIVEGDSIVAEQSALLERIEDVPGPSVIDYMAAAVQTIVVVQTAAATVVAKTASAAAGCTTVVVEN